jgi:hypothetical protein
MNLAWLAAVLRPRDVAPHPNFRPEAIDPPAHLASVVLGEDWRWDQASYGEDRTLLLEPDVGVEQVQRSLRPETQAVAVEELSKKLLREKPSEPARACALTLLTCCALAELDDGNRCLALIEAQLAWTANAKTSDERLVQAVLLQQQSLRLRDQGRAHQDSSAAALMLLKEVNVRECTPFALSPGVSWSYQSTLTQIIEAIRVAAYSLLPVHDLEEIRDGWASLVPTWHERVRAPAVEQILRIDRERASVYRGFLSDQFTLRYQGGGRVVIGRRPRDLFFTTLALELLGHANVYDARKELAEMRLLQVSLPRDRLIVDDALRLLRQAGATKELDLTLRSLRADGPLEALSVDARRILQMRHEWDSLRVVELKVLQAAAELLTRSEADLALHAVMDGARSGGPPNVPGKHELDTNRLETAWSTAASLANVAGRVNDVARLLLEEVISASVQDELRDAAVARALRVLSLNEMDEEVLATWKAALPQTRSLFPATAGVLESSVLAPTSLAREPLDLDRIAVRLNATMNSVAFDSDVTGPAVALVRNLLSEMRASAAKGTYSMRTIAPADVAAGLILYAGAVQLWEDLVDFLLDPMVQRFDRSPAFERLIRDAEDIPSLVRDRIVAGSATLLEAGPGAKLFESGLIPYPSGLRFLAVFGFIDEQRTFGLTARLAGSGGAEARREAARTVEALSRRTSAWWLLALALQLSHDADVETRAHAGTALARLGISSNSAAKLAADRVVELLREDGLLIPLLVLQGLSEIAALPDTIRAEVQEISVNHPSRQIREEAARILNGHSGGRQ